MSWNPVRYLNGWMCTKVSPGCWNCYAESMNLRFGNNYRYGDFSSKAEFSLDEKVLNQPLHWRTPRHIFVQSMGDLFHEKIPREFIAKVFDVACKAYIDKAHISQFLTKRPERMKNEFAIWSHLRGNDMTGMYGFRLGVSVENQEWADKRIPLLLQITAAVRFISAEPLLGPLDLWKPEYPAPGGGKQGAVTSWPGGLDWVIVGPETGSARRPCKVEWIEDIVAQCDEAGVPVFVKALPIGKRISHDPAEWPEHLRRREKPK